jgi:hypothetical protein
MKIIRIVLLTLVAAAAAGRLRAQDYRTFDDEYNDVRARKLLRIGPLRLMPTLRLYDLGYDSNVYYTNVEGDVVADTRATISPEVKAYWLLGSSLMLSCVENPEYVYYVHERPLRAFTNSFAPAARLILFRRFALSGDYHFSEHSRRSTSEFESPITDTRKGVNAAVFFETPRGSAVGVRGTQDDFDYSTKEMSGEEFYYARTLNRRERSAAGEFYYRVFTQSYLVASAGYNEYTFAFPESRWRDATSWQAAGGIRFPLLGRAKGQVTLGYKSFTPKDRARKSFSGLIANTDVTFRVGRFGFGLGYVRDNFFSYYESAYYYIEDRFRGALSFYLLPFLRVDGSYQTGSLFYPEPQTIWYGGEPSVLTGRKDVNRTAAVGLAVRVVGNTGIGVSYNFYRRTSNAPGFDIDRNFIGAYVTYEF